MLACWVAKPWWVHQYLQWTSFFCLHYPWVHSLNMWHPPPSLSGLSPGQYQYLSRSNGATTTNLTATTLLPLHWSLIFSFLHSKINTVDFEYSLNSAKEELWPCSRFPPHLAGMPRVEVSSDMRRLFAISGLEGYEKLRRENDELLATLSSMQARMTERLKSFSGVSMTEVRLKGEN